jgi:hypothetical protein
MGRTVFVAVALLISGEPAQAQQEEAGVHASSFNCGEWTEHRSSGTGIAGAYLVGLLDGLALGTRTEIWHAGGVRISGDQACLWMDKYCRENPLSLVVTGAFRLQEEQARKNR